MGERPGRGGGGRVGRSFWGVPSLRLGLSGPRPRRPPPLSFRRSQLLRRPPRLRGIQVPCRQPARWRWRSGRSLCQAAIIETRVVAVERLLRPIAGSHEWPRHALEKAPRERTLPKAIELRRRDEALDR